MDLVGAESRKTGTRGGRGNFTWDAVREEERSYYLGASVGKPLKARRGGSEGDWYLKPVSVPRPLEAAPAIAPVSRKRDTESVAGSACKTTPFVQRAAVAYAEVEAGAEAEIEGDRGGKEEADVVRRREKAIMARMLNGGASSFADAVRSALTESVGSGVDEEDAEDGVASGAGVNSGGSVGAGGSVRLAPNATGFRRDARLEAQMREMREKRDRAARKEMRRRIRESRHARRVERAHHGTSGSRGVNAIGGGGGNNSNFGNNYEGLSANVVDYRCSSQGAELGTAVPITITSGGGLADARVVQEDSSDSQRESAKGRPLEGRRRRRRRDRDSAPRRKRSDWSSTSESDDFDRHRSRRRLR